jgi:zinc protease
VLAEFREHGPTADELERHKAKIEFQAVNRLQSLMAKADALNRYQFFFGEPDSFRRDLDRYRQATVDDVTQWAREVLTIPIAA